MKKILLAIMVLGLSLSNICHAQSAKEAVRALQKLQARVEVGISYRDYGPALGDALFEVKLFLQSPEAKEKPDLAEAVGKAMQHYQNAATVWNIQFKTAGFREGWIQITYQGRTYDNPVCQENAKFILNLYPEYKPVSGDSKYGGHYSGIVIGDVVKLAWKKAGEELDKAMKLLSQ